MLSASSVLNNISAVLTGTDQDYSMTHSVFSYSNLVHAVSGAVVGLLSAYLFFSGRVRHI